MPYAYLEDVATADSASRAWDPTLEGVFVAADTTMNVDNECYSRRTGIEPARGR